jgi:hypothetical protein
MKLIIATCTKELQEEVQKIFTETKIDTYSSIDITGFKRSDAINLLQEWFAAGDEKSDSNLLFSFTDEEKAEQVLVSVKKYNDKNKTGFPIKGFIIPVDNFC